MAALLVLTALAIGAAGCGSDDESGDTTTVPTISVPSGEVQTLPEQKTTTTTPEQTTTDSGGSGGTNFNPSKPDSPTNDVPPAPGTPESKFEQYCKQNPGACG
jgi:hypothetical protein